jgi:hypothetical protein
MFCHGFAAVLYPLYLLLGMLAQLIAGWRNRVGPCQDDVNTRSKVRGFGKDQQGNLDIQEIHKHTAINTVIRS